MKKIVLLVLFSCLIVGSYAKDDYDPADSDYWIIVYPERPKTTDQAPVPVTVTKTFSDISVMFLVEMDEVLIEFLDSKDMVVLKKVVKGDPLHPVEINIENLPNGTYTIRFTEIKETDSTYTGSFDICESAEQE